MTSINGNYYVYMKRILDIILSAFALIVLSPILLLLIIIVAIKMKGNPFFTQDRPGKNEKIFKLIKFRSMTCAKDKDGNLLPDAQRLTKYGKILRSSSLDELPELINILKGDMSIVGPRPWAVSYLPYFTDEEKKRHLVRPGLTGLAQVNGRTAANWDERLKYDLEYVNNQSLILDIKIVLLTIKKVLCRSDQVDAGKQGDFSDYRKEQWEKGIVPKPDSLKIEIMEEG